MLNNSSILIQTRDQDLVNELRSICARFKEDSKNQHTKKAIEEIINSPFFVEKNLLNYHDFRDRVHILELSATGARDRQIQGRLESILSSGMEVIQLSFIKGIVAKGLDWHNKSFSRTIRSMMFDMYIGNFIRQYVYAQYGQEIKDIASYIDKQLNNNPELYLSLLSGDSNLSEVMDTIRPFILRYFKNTLSQHIKLKYNASDFSSDDVHTSFLTKYPEAKKIHLNKADFSNYINQFVSRFIEDIDDEMMILLSNRVIDVIMHYSRLLRQLIEGKSNTIEDHFNRYMFTSLEQEYETSNNNRVNKRNKQITPGSTPKNTLVSTNIEPASKHSINIIDYPRETRAFIGKICSYLVDKNDIDDLTKFMKRIRKNHKPLSIHGIIEEYEFNIESDEVEQLVVEAEKCGYSIREVSTKEVKNNNQGQRQNTIITNNGATELDYSLFLTDNKINGDLLIDYYSTNGYTFDNQAQFLSGIDKLNQTAVISNQTAVRKILLGIKRRNKVWLRRGSVRSMRINSHRLVRDGNHIIGLWDHDTYNKEMKNMFKNN